MICGCKHKVVKSPFSKVEQKLSLFKVLSTSKGDKYTLDKEEAFQL